MTSLISLKYLWEECCLFRCLSFPLTCIFVRYFGELCTSKPSQQCSNPQKSVIILKVMVRFTWPPVAMGRIEACRETEQNMKNIIFYVNIYARAAKNGRMPCKSLIWRYTANQMCVLYTVKIHKSPAESPAYNNSHDPPPGRSLGLIDKSLVAEMTCCIFKSMTNDVILCIT